MPPTEPTIVVVGWSARDVAERYPGEPVVNVGSAADTAAAVTAASGRGVIVAVDAGPEVLESLVADLRRVGPVRVLRDPAGEAAGAAALPAEVAHLLDLLAQGQTLGAAAQRLAISRRTADRRLARARELLRVSTTAQAIAARRAGGSPAGSGTRMGPDLLGRQEALAAVSDLLGSDRAVLVVGEGGVGKSALVSAAASASGRPVQAASALAVMRIRRFWPVAQAVGVDLIGDVEAVTARVESLVGPDLLVVDDVHLADESTLAVLGALVGRVAVVVAARPDPGGTPGPVDRLAEAGFTAVPVEPLADDDAAALARAWAPDLPEPRIREVVAGSAGLPLLVEFLSGRDPDAPLGRGLVPDVRALDSAQFTAALRLALAGTPLPPDACTESLVRAGVATVRPDGQAIIRHALVSEAVIAAADPADVQAAHRDLAQSATDLGIAAQHWRAAGDLAQATAAASSAAAAAHSAVDRARLLALAAECAPEAERGGAVLAAGAALSEVGLHAEVLSVLQAPGVPLGDATDLARACLLRARAQWHAGDSSAASASAAEGLELIARTGGSADPRTEAGLRVERVRCQALRSGVTAEHDSELARAAELLGDGPGRAGLLSVVGIVDYLRTGAVRAWEAGREAALAEGDVDSLLRCSNNVIMWHESVGDPAAGLALALEMVDDAERRGMAEWRCQFQAMAANLLYHGGRYGPALALLEAVESDALDARTRRQARVCHASLLIDLGMLDAAARLLPPRPAPNQPDWMHDDSVHYLYAALAQASGRPREALAVSRELTQRGSASGDILAFLAPVRAWAEFDLGLPVTPVGDAGDLPVVQGLLLEARGVALLADDAGSAAEVLREAAELSAGWTYGPSLRARWGAAEALRLAGRPDAVDALLAVEEQVVAAGLEPLLARVHRSLRLAGVSRSAPRAADRSGLLTARERQVLDLVAGGASYEAIGRRLGVGRPTVRRLLENARGKLGAGSRLGAVAAMSSR